MAITYINLSGTSEDFNVEVPYGDDMVFNLKLKDKSTGEYQNLTSMSFTIELFRSDTSTQAIWKKAGVIQEDNITVQFTKKILQRISDQYFYRIRKTVDDTTTTPVRGGFYIS